MSFLLCKPWAASSCIFIKVSPRPGRWSVMIRNQVLYKWTRWGKEGTHAEVLRQWSNPHSNLLRINHMSNTEVLSAAISGYREMSQTMSCAETLLLSLLSVESLVLIQAEGRLNKNLSPGEEVCPTWWNSHVKKNKGEDTKAWWTLGQCPRMNYKCSYAQG